ncbi:PHP domain-containing protein [Alkalihalobacillus sp. 1P02AB]|uniref:PHP domain-containing protein n=1 Tax=Alkalihalobacillus sp. 1P02AB TaxID=3132260 RepID=UPI0039A5CCC4
MSNQQADLHMHSTASDGGYTPAELMRKCKDVGLQYVALTDHDTVSGIKEAEETATELGMTFIPGIELSTKFKGKGVHILGYGIDVHDVDFLTMLTQQQKQREKRLEVILTKLKACDIDLEKNDVLQFVDGGSIGRPHIAKALVKRGFVSDVAEAFDLYLAEGKPAFVGKEKEMSVKEAIDWIHRTGGLAIVAHPGHYGLDESIIDWVKNDSLDGIEIYHRDHLEIEQQKYRDIQTKIEQALNKSLVITGGSDFHHEDYGRTIEPLGQTRIDNAYAVQLIKRLEKKR